jgi:hypothetical protein
VATSSSRRRPPRVIPSGGSVAARDLVVYLTRSSGPRRPTLKWPALFRRAPQRPGGFGCDQFVQKAVPRFGLDGRILRVAEAVPALLEVLAKVERFAVGQAGVVDILPLVGVQHLQVGPAERAELAQDAFARGRLAAFEVRP